MIFGESHYLPAARRPPYPQVPGQDTMFMTEVKMQNAAISVEGDFQCGKFFIRVHFFENTSKIRARYEHLSNKNTSKIRAKIRVKLKLLF